MHPAVGSQAAVQLPVVWAKKTRPAFWRELQTTWNTDLYAAARVVKWLIDAG